MRHSSTGKALLSWYAHLPRVYLLIPFTTLEIFRFISYCCDKKYPNQKKKNVRGEVFIPAHGSRLHAVHHGRAVTVAETEGTVHTEPIIRNRSVHTHLYSGVFLNSDLIWDPLL